MTLHMKSFNTAWLDSLLSPEDCESLINDHKADENRTGHMLQDFLAVHWESYCSRHKVPEEKLKIMNSIKDCKTGRLGYTITHCRECGSTVMYACGCGNRNCPSCGYLNEQKWIALRQSEVIPGIPYFHMVFTLPHELSEIMYKNQKDTLNLLFSSVKDSILCLSRDKLGMVPGIVMLLHTFGSNLSLHYHLHVLVSGGGLSPDKKQFIYCRDDKYFLPVKMLADVYKAKFMDGLKSLRSSDRLKYTGLAEKYRNSYVFKELLDVCYQHEWNVDVRRLGPVSAGETQASEKAETTDNAISYFARYTNRTAISNSRIISFDEDYIRFRYKSYEGESYTVEEMELEPDEFIRRFLMHLLPGGFTRIRFAGFLACSVKKKNLELIYTLLEREYREDPIKNMSSSELIKHFYGTDIYECSKCHSRLEIYPRINMSSVINPIRAA